MCADLINYLLSFYSAINNVIMVALIHKAGLNISVNGTEHDRKDT